MGTAYVVTGLAFGDEGKGAVVDWLCRQPLGPIKMVVRFNGGGQAGHNVVTPDGRHHTFSHFGSGSFVRGVRTHLSRFMLVSPTALFNEAIALGRQIGGDPRDLLTIDEHAVVVTAFHKHANQLRELERARGAGRHGSCGMGIGETVADSLAHPETVIYARDLRDRRVLTAKLARVQELKLAEFPAPRMQVGILDDSDAVEFLAELYHDVGGGISIVAGDYLRHANGDSLVFEGAQGVLLDEAFGCHPYTTWSTTTPKNALTLLREAGYSGAIERVGVSRAYFTRHGPGPFPTEDATMGLCDSHNRSGPWQGPMRFGWFDAVLARYAIEVSGVDWLALNHLDYFPSRALRVCVNRRHENPWGTTTPDFESLDVEALAAMLAVPIKALGWGPQSTQRGWAPWGEAVR